MGSHAAAVGLVCLALAGSLAACSVAPAANPEPRPVTPQPSPGGGSPSSSTTPSPSPSPTPPPTRTAPHGLIVFDGDSLTAGFMLAGSQSYPAQVQRRLPSGIRCSNVAVSGQVWPDLLEDVSTEVDPLYSKGDDINIVVVWAGANDLTGGSTAQEIYQNARTYCLGRQMRGFTVVTCTMYPLQPKDYDPDYEALRLEYNQLLRDGWPHFADALVDLAADARIGDASPETRAGYFVDIVHLNEDGYAVVADAVTETLRTLIDRGM